MNPYGKLSGIGAPYGILLAQGYRPNQTPVFGAFGALTTRARSRVIFVLCVSSSDLHHRAPPPRCYLELRLRVTPSRDALPHAARDLFQHPVMSTSTSLVPAKPTRPLSTGESFILGGVAACIAVRSTSSAHSRHSPDQTPDCRSHSQIQQKSPRRVCSCRESSRKEAARRSTITCLTYSPRRGGMRD